MRKKSEPTGIDVYQMAEMIDELREALRMIVAGLMIEGFTEEQARDIVAGVYRTISRD